MSFEGLSFPVSNTLGKMVYESQQSQQDEKKTDETVGRVGAGFMLVAALIESAVAGLFTVVSHFMKSCGAPKKWHDFSKKWCDKATEGVENLWAIACGKTNKWKPGAIDRVMKALS